MTLSILVLVLGFFAIHPDKEVVTESFTIDELLEQEDVVQYLKKNGCYDDIALEYSSAMENQDEVLLDNVNETREESDLPPITLEELKKINQKYGLEDAATENAAKKICKEKNFLVEYDQEGNITAVQKLF